MAERVGFEALHPLRQGVESNATSESGEEKISAPASQVSNPLCPELEKLVQAWPNLRPELQAAVTAIINSAT
jgi:hypothetical protein